MIKFASLRYKEEMYSNTFAWHYAEIAKIKSKPYAIFVDGHLHSGCASKHRTYPARMMRIAQRLKDRRNTIPY